MKNLVKKVKIVEVTIGNLMGDEIIAYKCKSDSNSYAILAKLLHSNWGFVPLNNSNSNPRYVAQSWDNTVNKAAECRNLKVFDSMNDLIESIHNRDF